MTVYDALRRLAGRTGATALLERIGFRAPLGDLVRHVVSTEERRRSRAHRRDFEACADRLRRLAAGAPHGEPGRVAWIVSSFPTVWGWKLEGVLSLATRLGGFEPQAVYLSHHHWGRRYHELFGLKRALNFKRFLAAEGSTPGHREVEEFIRDRPSVRDLLRLSYRDVDVGRIALSNVLEQRKFARFDLADPATLDEVRTELLRIHGNVLAAERMVARHRPLVGLLLEKGLSPAAEVFGVCVAHGIPIVQYLGSHEQNHYALKRYSRNNRHQHPFSLDAETWEWARGMPWGPEHEAELMREFEEGYAMGTWFGRKFLHHGKQIKSAEAVRRQLGLDPTQKTAVIFSHVLWDATFFYGEGLFDDYETWLLETVRAACANPRVNWVVKLHPDLVWKLKYEGYTGELRDLLAMRNAVGTLPPHVKLVLPDTDISTYSFFAVADYCITVRGTIGIEMACHGTPVLTAGTGRYAGLGFTIDSSSVKEYLERLAHIETIPPVASEKVELARRFAYALFKLRPWPVTTFKLVKLPLAQIGHPLDNNLVVHAETFGDFAAAPDIGQFADWVASNQIDYMQPVVGRGRA